MEIHQVESEEEIAGTSVLMTRREPKTDAERDSYWYKAYMSMEIAAKRFQKRIVDLEQILATQIKTNNAVGVQMGQQDEMVQERFNGHNDEMRGMAEEIMMLRKQVTDLGGVLKG